MHHGAAGLGFRLEQGSGLSEGLLAVVLVLLGMAASQRRREGRRALGVWAPALLACHVGGDRETWGGIVLWIPSYISTVSGQKRAGMFEETREMPPRQLAPPVLIRPRCLGQTWSV